VHGAERDGRVLASGSEEGIIRLWEVPGEQSLATLQAHTGPAYGVALSADGRLLASGGRDGTVRLWETLSGRPLSAVQAHSSGFPGSP
jgi:WD40 repeat protein